MMENDALLASPEQMRLGFEDERAWSDAMRRLRIIEPLVDRTRTTAEVRERAVLAGCHLTTVYAWLRRYESERTLAALLPGRSDGGRGKSRLSAEEERILVDSIDAYVRDGRRSSVRALCEKIRVRCFAENVSAPHPNTIRSRVSARVRQNPGQRANHRATGVSARVGAQASVPDISANVGSVSSIDRIKRYFEPRSTSV